MLIFTLLEIFAYAFVTVAALCALGALIYGFCWLLTAPFWLMADAAAHLPNGPRQPLVLFWWLPRAAPPPKPTAPAQPADRPQPFDNLKRRWTAARTGSWSD
jgi:hypothetical protein